jgi:hypothetical protein
MDNPVLCPHIVDDNTPFAGMPDANNKPRFYCPACLIQRIAVLVQTLNPVSVFRRMHVPQEHAQAITRAMMSYTLALKQSQPTQSLIRNRTQCVARYIANSAGLGRSKQERFQRYKFNQDDNRGPSYKRTQIIPRLREPKSLSKYSDVVAFNRVEVAG